MGQFGYKIKNYQAGSIYGYELGIRDKYDSKDAMLTNSLFLDYLKENGLQVWKEESTRDIICLEFGYGVKSFKEEIRSIEQRIKNKKTDYEKGKIKDKEFEEYVEIMNRLKEQATERQNKFKKKTRQQLREEYYKNGVDILYETHNKKGEVIKSEKIHYKMLYRTPGKAKKGTCMFIRDSLYDKAVSFLRMGIELPDEGAPIVEIGAYSSLSTSTIVGKVTIKPEEILVIKDIDVFFNTKVISVELDENNHCIAVPKDNYKVKNTLFDGQALIDNSIFPEWGDGYILLRHHFCKMAAFRTNIQLFFQDYFGDQYETAVLEDYWGNKILARNVKLITTENAMKWMKFGVSFDYWSDWVRKNDCQFGIVKTAHPSKLGEVQRMSYQMVNALDMDLMEDICKETLDYIQQLKRDDNVFLDYLKRNANFSNDYEVLVALVEHNPEFVRCDYFRNRKHEIIRTYTKYVKTGKLIQQADNLVIVGSPYAMLLASVGDDYNRDDTFNIEDGAIQCYTERFADGEYLAGFRNPFNSRNNLDYLHNHYDDRFKRYFQFGPLIIALNMIGTDAQDRNNGSDQDSDSLYVTNQSAVVDSARRFYKSYATIVNNIPKDTNHYNNTLKDFSLIDNNLAASQRAIGEASNLAQIALSYTYNFPEDAKLFDNVCILSVLAQCAIDNAKRKFDIDITEEISLIKQSMKIDQRGYPAFWSLIRPNFNKSKINKQLKCPMNYVYRLKPDSYNPTTSTLPIQDFFIKHEFTEHHKISRKVEKLIEKYSLQLLIHGETDDNTDSDLFMMLEDDYEKLIKDIHQVYLSKNYVGLISKLINRAFVITSGVKRQIATTASQTNYNKALLLKALYDVSPNSFLACFCGKNKAK